MKKNSAPCKRSPGRPFGQTGGTGGRCHDAWQGLGSSNGQQQSGWPGIVLHPEQKEDTHKQDHNQQHGRPSVPTRPDHHRQSAQVALAKMGALAALSLGVLSGCASTPAEPVPLKPVPAWRSVRREA
ncbi:hypothetical protein B0G75_116131 [Paraburkholderia sp. BL18I3N2]|uniref:hypothetical protein n=1 Tax=Paraburkholderia sp. BL18I3N2 TaxID=1938799 RepID=UPI000D07F635|nr:hypothetical protein [Paraburkholderia sp. BL18I3N2]PRX27101.1 hypothetical protein B0G75_116131 [Paraburkholderia sp. BL18I3N2]